MATAQSQTKDGALFAPQSPDLPSPHRFQRAQSVIAMSTDYEKAVQREQHQHRKKDESREESLPWWQYYYQLYQYHPPPGRKPTVFGPYLLLQTLGEGEFGKVKLGVHIDRGYEVAIKLMKKDHIDSSSRMTKTVRHPYIVKLYDVIETEKYIGIILQCASGGELFEYILAHRYLKEKDASRLFAQLISGVHYMHQKHIVHRDLKLENLLLDRNRSVIITDFGFANQFASARDDLMQTSCGSPCYAAPELVISEGLYVGTAVDIWSCGVILYAMLCGYLPFDDDPANPESDNINLLYKYILNTPLAFPEFVSLEAQDLLRQMLVPDPTKRCTMHAIMNHPWLDAHRTLFDKTTEELEEEAMASCSQPYMPSTSVTGPPNVAPAALDVDQALPVTKDEPMMDVDGDQHVPVIEAEDHGHEHEHYNTNGDDDEGDQMAPDDMVPITHQSPKPSLVTMDTENNKDDSDDAAVSPATQPQENGVEKTEEDQEDATEGMQMQDDNDPMQEVPSLQPVKGTMAATQLSASVPDISSLELPASLHTDESSASSATPTAVSVAYAEKQVERKEKSSQESNLSKPPSTHGSQTSSTSSRKGYSTDKLIQFLSSHPPSSGAYNHHRKSTPPPASRPMSILNPQNGGSILHAKFLSSMQRHVSLSRNDKEDVARHQSMSTPHVTPVTFSPMTPSTPPQPKAGTSHPVRGTRRKALSLLVKPMTDYIGEEKKPRKTAFARTRERTQSMMQRQPKDTVSTTPSSTPWNVMPSVSERSTMDKEKHKSAGKKLMEWFKKKPQSTRDRTLNQSAHGDLLAPTGSTMTVSTTGRAMPIGKPLGSYAIDFNDSKLRTHHGAVDQDALTSREPYEVFDEVRQSLMAMGIEVKRNGEYKLKCIRHKRDRKPFVQRLLNRRSTSTAASPAGHPESESSPSGSTGRPPCGSTNSGHSGNSGNTPVTTLYGDESVDRAEEVRFSVELCKIKNLPGLYIVDIRRMRGSVWSYKFLYHALLDNLNLSGKGGYHANTLPSANKPTPAQLLNVSRHENRISCASSGGSSSILEEPSKEDEATE